MYQYSNAYEVYQNNQVNTLSWQFLLMLYDGALKFLRFALQLWRKRILRTPISNFVKTQDIISEYGHLISMPGSNQLYSLYDFMIQELIDANIKKMQKSQVGTQ